MQYISTRGNYKPVESAEAIVMGMVPRGGLFVPEKLPQLDIQSVRSMDYAGLANAVLSLFLEGTGNNYSGEEIKQFIAKAYSAENFESTNIAPIAILDDKTSILELFRGPTAAFKDVALQIMPHFLKAGMVKLKKNKEVVILVATSGDTGKAALEGYKDVKGIRIIVFYPKNGVSKVQEMQMMTTGGKNTSVVAVEGNFDDCQTMVKNIFADEAYNAEINKAGFEFSSANSINWGRLVPQIVYYFHAYFQMIRNKQIGFGDDLVAVVPTGNFGNILAGFYAKEMGLPLTKLVCASNKNNVLSDFIQTGIYDKKRDFYKTSSPSMDILISSNLERFLFEIANHNINKINRWYDDLNKNGLFRVDDTTRQRMKHILFGGFATERETFECIRNTFESKKYLLDTHTAVGVHVLNEYRKETGDQTPAFVCGTASPYKFNQAVYSALTKEKPDGDEFEVLNKLEKLSGVPIHRSLKGLDKLSRKDELVIKKTQSRDAIRALLKK